MAMRIPVMQGRIKRRLLVNFRADAEVVQRMLPEPFRPKLHRGWAVAGICLIRLEKIRPAGLPAVLGLASENAAHRIAVEWNGPDGMPREGVFIPRRDSDSLLNRLAGGRIFPGEHHAADFAVVDTGKHIELEMRSKDGSVQAKVAGDEAETLPVGSCFGSLAEASAFFEGGSLGYSMARGGERLDGLRLRTLEWRVRALEVAQVESSFFANGERFPKGSVEFDHALVMRDVAHEWHAAEDLRKPAGSPAFTFGSTLGMTQKNAR